jgi:hypothetical protein
MLELAQSASETAEQTPSTGVHRPATAHAS